MPGSPKRKSNEEILQKLPSYECMLCGAREHLSPVPRPIEVGGHLWWCCRAGYGCALTSDGTAGKL